MVQIIYTWFVTFKGRTEIRVFENKLLKRISEPEKRSTVELHCLKFSYSTARLIKLKMM
jgi:hypothetical protein